MTQSFLDAMGDSSKGNPTARFEQQYTSEDFRVLKDVHACACGLLQLEQSPLGLEAALQQAGSSLKQHAAEFEGISEALNGLLERLEDVEDVMVAATLGYMSLSSAGSAGDDEGDEVALFQCTPEALER